MRFVAVHLPHIIPGLVALAFLVRFAAEAADQPSVQLSDVDLIAWRTERAQRRVAARVRRTTSRIGLASLPGLLLATGTGLWLYTEALRDERPSPALRLVHVVASALALGVISWKLVEHGRIRISRRLADGSSLVLGLLALPLTISGTALVLSPSSSSRTAYVHLIAASWWMVLLGIHLLRYLSRSLDAALRGRASDEPRP